MHLFGIDLAFTDRHSSGLFVLNHMGREVSHAYLTSDTEIVGFVHDNLHSEGNVIVIDGPLVVPNHSGQRPCETLVGLTYGARGASCHSSNTQLDSGQRGPTLMAQLQAVIPEVNMAVDAGDASPLSFPVIETYPHPGHIELFGLDGILKYKHKSRRSMSSCRRAMADYQNHLTRLANDNPRLDVATISLLEMNTLTLRGRLYKQHEDLLDALFCAYVALYLWTHRFDHARHKIFGDIMTGAITIPVR